MSNYEENLAGVLLVSTSLVGRTLGHYKVIGLLGQGGMATVYTAYQESVDRQVAIKVLPPHPGLDLNFAERFELEARTIARLQHPHILPLYDYGKDDDILYLVMAYADGGTLEDLIRDGPLDLDFAQKVLREIAGALDYAHRQGVIHRDIKPPNILMSGEGHALLADFGIVKLAESSSNMTGTGVVGTPSYMAPEQAQGMPIDNRADIYSLGVVTYQMITGRQPFSAPSLMQIMLKVMQEPPPSIHEVASGLPDELDVVMQRVLEKDPNARYQTAVEFADAFAQVVTQSYTSVGKATPKTPAVPLSEAQTAALEPQSQTQAANDSQTVIIREGTNPWLFLGAFAILAIAIIAVVIIVVGGNDGAVSNDDNDAVAIATSAGVESTNDDEPLIIPTRESNIPDNLTSFTTTNSLGDSLAITAELEVLGTGLVYVAWLYNTETDEALNLGNMVIDQRGNASLTYINPDGKLLPLAFDVVAITVESSEGLTEAEIAALEAPQGEVQYHGRISQVATDVMYNLLVSSEAGIPTEDEAAPVSSYGSSSYRNQAPANQDNQNASLLDSARAEAEFAQQHAGLAAGSTNADDMHAHAEHTINILRGEEVDYNGDRVPENFGLGFGIYGFLDEMETQLNRLADVQDASVARSNAVNIRACIENSRQRADRILVLEAEILGSERIDDVQAQLAESTQLAQHLIEGVDANNRNGIQGAEGECGLDQIEIFGVALGNVEIIEGDLE